MIYPSDFNFYPKKMIDNKFERKCNTLQFYDGKQNEKIFKKFNNKRKIITAAHNNNNNNNNNNNDQKEDHQTEFNNMSLWERYCLNSTVHGLRYITDRKLHLTERITWITLVMLAGIGVLYVSLLLQKRFTFSPLATVVESTIYPIYEISYPAVTICNYNRLNWKHINLVTDLLKPNADNRTRKNLITIMEVLDVFEYGSFEEFAQIQNESLIELEHLNISYIYNLAMLKCEEMFYDKCWWRNKYINCCKIFTKQESEYGICYAFNSGLNDVGRSRMMNEKDYPWRTSNYGDWSGLRLNANLDPSTKRPKSSNLPGILVIVHHPLEWPNSGNFIPSGSTTSIVIKPTYSYTTSNVKRLSHMERDCLYPNEVKALNFMTLPNVPYLRSNCLSECRQQHMLHYCSCTLDFLFPTGDYPICNVSALKCLYKYDSIFNYEKPPMGNQYFSSNETGMVCPCLPECERIDYALEISPIQSKDETNDKIVLDVHFQQATMVKYRTNVVYDWLDLIVAFGGIAGLFLGSSLLSVAELIFYLTIGIITFFKNNRIESKPISIVTNKS